jgi:multiple sugar transport system substrate-binding protein
MSDPIQPLRGITWGHTRGLVPLQATAQRFSEVYPGVEIQWEKRSLKDFEEFPIERLAEHYDLLVIDHPFIGYAANHRVFLPLDEWLPPAFLADQKNNSVGGSYASYVWESHLWALPIDAATPVAAWRPDLLLDYQISAPRTWEEVLALGSRGGVEIPGAPINSLMNFFGLCATLGEAPFSQSDRVVSLSIGSTALAHLRDLVAMAPSAALTRNPIQSLEMLSSDSNRTLAYCLFPYGYSNYARRGYSTHLLTFGDLPEFDTGRPLITTLGGTGLAISARSKRPRLAADYAAYVASEGTQRTVYTQAGGQPGHRSAWLDAENNHITGDYFRSTLPALDRAFVRPRYSGYLHGFQEPAAPIIQRCVRGETDPAGTLAELDKLYVRSLHHN